MNAEEMFKELQYEKVNGLQEGFIQCKNTCGLYKQYITFDSEKQGIQLEGFERGGIKNPWLIKCTSFVSFDKKDLFLAIVKQIEELGW